MDETSVEGSGDGGTTRCPPLESLAGTSRTTIPALLSARVHATPDRPFLIWEGRSWTYAEIWRKAQRVAGWILAQSGAGSRPPTRVASFLGNRPEAIWVWLGAELAGSTFVPLNRSHRGVLLQDMIARSRSHLLFTDEAGRLDLPSLDATLHRVVAVDEMSTRDELSTTWSRVGSPPKPSDLAEVLFTSGTTGRSKAVMLSHNQLCRGAGWIAWSVGLDAHDVIHAWLPMSHVAGQIDCVLASIVGGGSLAFYPTFSRSKFWGQVAESHATVMIGFSNVLELLNATSPIDTDSDSTLRVGIVGGVSAELSTSFQERFHIRLHDIYGMTEVEPIALPTPNVPPPPGAWGPPRPDLEIAVIDDAQHAVSAGVVGEIAVRPREADLITTGYEGDEEATTAVTTNGWFRTGDLGRYDEEGNLSFVDRRKDAIRRRGENVSSWELERVILTHPDIADCSALSVPSPLGDDDVKVVVVPQPRRPIDPAELHEWCEGKMAGFMIPRYIQVVHAIPRSSVGKVLKDQLRMFREDTWDAIG